MYVVCRLRVVASWLLCVVGVCGLSCGLSCVVWRLNVFRGVWLIGCGVLLSAANVFLFVA